MVNLKSFPNNQDEYIGAEDVMRWHYGRSSGVFSGARNLDVSVVAGTMSVTVSDGVGWLSDNKGHGIAFWNDLEETTGNKLTLEFETADSTYDRIDRIVVTWNLADNFVSLPTISVRKGTPSASPSAPSITNDSVKREISIWEQRIPAGSTVLSEALGTDERLNPVVCGIVSDNVKINTLAIQVQFDAVLKSIQNELAQIQGGTGFDPIPIRKKNIILYNSYFTSFEPTIYEDSDLDSFSEEVKLYEHGYIYRAQVPIDNVISSMFPFLTFSLSDIEDSGVEIANQFLCYDGGVYVYSKDIPSGNINILTAEFRKAVS